MELLPELQEIISYCQNNKVIALLAPTFPIDFSYPKIILDLKKIWCEKVVELTYAAKLINQQYRNLLKTSDKQRICTNCPALVNIIKNKYPQHKEKLANIASPMIIMSRIVKEQFGKEYKTIFIGPCFAKKIEAQQTGEVDKAITFKELQQIFDRYKEKNLPYKENFAYEVTEDGKPDFDKFYNDYTKIYPLPGAVAQTMHSKWIINPNQIYIADGIQNIEKAMQTSESNPEIKFFDLLTCSWGCTWGPGIINFQFSPDKKEAKIISYQKRAKKTKIGNHLGKVKKQETISFENTFL